MVFGLKKYGRNLTNERGKKDFNQSVNRFSLGGKWESSIDGLDYNVNAGYSYFGYGKDDIYDGIFLHDKTRTGTGVRD